MILRENIKRLDKDLWRSSEIFIAGGTGFLGKALISVLESMGCTRCKIVTRDKSLKGRKYIHCDLTEEKEVRVIKSYIKHAKFIFIFSGNFPKNSGGDIDFNNCLKNITMVKNLIDGISKETKKVILASSTDVYGIPDGFFVNEQYRVDPLNYYALSKFIQEKIVEYNFRNRLTKYLILRFTHMYGQNEPPIKFLPVLLNNIVKNKPFTFYGDGCEKRDFLNVEDAAILALYLAQEEASGIFNISTAKGTAFNELLNLAGKISKKKILLRYKKGVKPEKNLIFDNQKMLNLIKDFRFKPLSDGIKEQYEALCKINVKKGS